jgi:drug/metabolite transporter (DMT)-like permease
LRRVLPTTALVGAILALASTPILFRLSDLGPTATAFHRTFLAVPLLASWAAVARWSHGPAASILRADKWLLVAAGAMFALNIFPYTWAIHLTSVASASLLANTSPLFVTIGLVVIGAVWLAFGSSFASQPRWPGRSS